jgi:hypothetical protein
MNFPIQQFLKGATIALGRVSLLPLNIPAHKPLMYCNVSEIAQTNIRFDDNIYSCGDNSIGVSCEIIDECPRRTMSCDVPGENENIFCTNATLISRTNLVCNSTVLSEEGTTILNCYPRPRSTGRYTEKLSLGEKMHNYFLNVNSRSDPHVGMDSFSQNRSVERDPVEVEAESFGDSNSEVELLRNGSYVLGQVVLPASNSTELLSLYHQGKLSRSQMRSQWHILADEIRTESEKHYKEFFNKH